MSDISDQVRGAEEISEMARVRVSVLRAYERPQTNLEGKALGQRAYWIDLHIPAWDTRRTVSMPLTALPESLHKGMQTPGYRFFATVDLSVENAEDMYLKSPSEKQ